MTIMGALAELLQRPKPVVWLDAHDYSARLLANGSAPWLDTAAFVAWQRKAHGLLKPDVVVLPLVPAIDAWLAAHDDLRVAMAAKSRTVYPLKTLLADEALRAHLVELARGLRVGVAGVSGPPLALVLPSPRAWVEIAYRQAHGEAVEVGEDEADSASVFIADFLRVFGEAGVDALKLEDTTDAATCQSVLNLATHYRWDVLMPDAPQPNLRFLRIAPDANPEKVLQQIASLR